jgi:hypothetical protein
MVPRKLIRQFQDFKKLVEARGSFHNLRMAQKAAVSPLLPYLGTLSSSFLRRLIIAHACALTAHAHAHE